MRHMIRRVGFYVAALWASVTLNFLIPRLTPGNPAEAAIARLHGHGVSARSLQALEALYGVSHDSWWTQYWNYINDMLHGNLGVSFTSLEPVTTVIGRDLWWTLALVGAAVIISFVVGTILGVIVAWRHGSVMDTALIPFFTFISAVPYFWLALALLYFLGYVQNWFPLNGGYDVNSVTPGWNVPFFASAFQYALLPAFTIVIGSIGGWMLGMRNTMITTLSEDYVLLAEAKGLPTRRVMIAYAARNAILPNITSFTLSLGFVVSGSLLTEIVFNYPGLGYALLQAVENLDYPLMQGLFLVISLAVLIANFLTDLLYVALDPRVRSERG